MSTKKPRGEDHFFSIKKNQQRSKEEIRKEMAAATAAYLAHGGVIKQAASGATAQNTQLAEVDDKDTLDL